jgi:hypothetical protein
MQEMPEFDCEGLPESSGALLEDYPHLTTEDVRAAVAYGAASIAHEEVLRLPNEPLASKP